MSQKVDRPQHKINREQFAIDNPQITCNADDQYCLEPTKPQYRHFAICWVLPSLISEEDRENFIEQGKEPNEDDLIGCYIDNTIGYATRLSGFNSRYITDISETYLAGHFKLHTTKDGRTGKIQQNHVDTCNIDLTLFACYQRFKSKFYEFGDFVQGLLSVFASSTALDDKYSDELAWSTRLEIHAHKQATKQKFKNASLKPQQIDEETLWKIAKTVPLYVKETDFQKLYVDQGAPGDWSYWLSWVARVILAFYQHFGLPIKISPRILCWLVVAHYSLVEEQIRSMGKRMTNKRSADSNLGILVYFLTFVYRY